MVGYVGDCLSIDMLRNVCDNLEANLSLFCEMANTNSPGNRNRGYGLVVIPILSVVDSGLSYTLASQ